MKTSFPIPYGLNVHPGQDGSAVRRTLRTHVLAVKALAAPDRSFPLGLYLSSRAVEDLRQPRRLASLRSWLDDHNCFVACVNAFPFGRFHGDPVKTRVYRPDWRSNDRLRYTCRTADLLAALIPEGADTTLTTLPGGWLPDWESATDDRKARQNLSKAVAHCRRLSEQSGRRIRLAIEPEPGCAWELFDPRLEELEPDLCWCLDTCHAAVEFRPLTGLEWQRIGRVQLSSAVECCNTPEAREALRHFAEPVYLHQTRAALNGKIIGRWPDLPKALAALPRLPAAAVVRTHYHVPLTWTGGNGLQSTASRQLTPAFFRKARTTCCEVETYTYSVLPPSLRPRTLAGAIAAELQWAAARYGSSSSTKRKITSPGLA